MDNHEDEFSVWDDNEFVFSSPEAQEFEFVLLYHQLAQLTQIHLNFLSQPHKSKTYLRIHITHQLRRRINIIPNPFRKIIERLFLARIRDPYYRTIPLDRTGQCIRARTCRCACGRGSERGCRTRCKHCAQRPGRLENGRCGSLDRHGCSDTGF